MSQPQGYRASNVDQKDYVNETFEWNHLESNPRPSGL